GKEARIILDVAASTIFKNGKYYFEGESFNQQSLSDFYIKLCRKYPIIAIEDPFAEDDWESFQEITQVLGENIDIIGDDMLATNIERIKNAQKKAACNALILKPNQAGTVSETIKAAKLAKKEDWEVFVKHRSGETCDSFISDLAVGLGTGWIMAGAPNRGERVAKYNRLLMIEQEINGSPTSLKI
ncbi:phosphopyruvate hydratase, partial [Patescibacteria group bacterium]|nr:phosphopyruvate hydratase [Patescibacteria group bacterium]